jgi:L-lactate dehydrogenase (cytochrome)
MSTCSLEDIADATDRHPFMFQLYVLRDRNFFEKLFERARHAGCDALQLTLDLTIIGRHHKDTENRLTA